jgi:hypothetical protein
MVDNLDISKATKWLKKFERIPFLNIKTISSVYTIKYMVTGFSLAILIHSIYNYFMSTGRIIFAVATVIIGVALFYKVTRVKSHNKNYNALKEKITQLQEMKALKDRLNQQMLQQKTHTSSALSSLR